MTTDPELEIECPICGEHEAEVVKYDGNLYLLCSKWRDREWDSVLRAAPLDDEPENPSERLAVERAREDARQGRTHSTEELLSDLSGEALDTSTSTLVDQLTQHIDHDSPPGLGARELANLILQLTAGIGGKEAALLVDRLSEMIVRGAKESSDV